MVECWEFAETFCTLEAKAEQNTSSYTSRISIKQYEDSTNKTTMLFQLPPAPKSLQMSKKAELLQQIISTLLSVC